MLETLAVALALAISVAQPADAALESGLTVAEFEVQPCELRLSSVGRKANFRGLLRLELETDRLGTPTKVIVPSSEKFAVFLEIEPIKECVAR